MSDDMLNRVRALLTKAESSEFPEEAEALTAKATELMAKYNIDAALATAFGDRREMPVDKVIFIENPYAARKAKLYYNILLIFGGDAVRTSSGANTILRVYGFDADLMAVDVLYTSLLLQAAHQSQRVPAGENARSYRSSFFAGFTNAIIPRLKDAYGRVVAESKPGTDLVLRDRSLEIAALMRHNHPKAKRTPTARPQSTAGWNAGREAGERANIHNRSAATAGRRKALS